MTPETVSTTTPKSCAECCNGVGLFGDGCRNLLLRKKLFCLEIYLKKRVYRICTVSVKKNVAFISEKVLAEMQKPQPLPNRPTIVLLFRLLKCSDSVQICARIDSIVCFAVYDGACLEGEGCQGY